MTIKDYRESIAYSGFQTFHHFKKLLDILSTTRYTSGLKQDYTSAKQV